MDQRLTKMQWVALTSLLWLSPLAWVASLGNGLAAGKAAALGLALVGAGLWGAGVLWLSLRSGWQQFLRREAGPGADFARNLLAVYLLLVAGRFLWGAGALWSAWSAAETPGWVFFALLLLLAAYSLHRGCRAVLRWAVLEVAALPLAALLDSLLLLPRYRWSRLDALTAWTEGSWRAAGQLFLPLVLALPVLLWFGAAHPRWKNEGERSWKPGLFALGGWLLGGGYLLLLTLRDSLVQGVLTAEQSYPLLRTLGQVQLGAGLNRVEYLAVLLLLGLCCTGGLLLAAAAGEMLSLSRPWKRGGSRIFSILLLAAAAWL